MSLAPQRLSPSEYLEFERASDTRHEYADGLLFAMAGAKRRRNLVSSNVSGELRAQMKGRPCEVYSSDMRVKVSPTAYAYPDVVAFCGEARFEDEEEDTLLNPSLIVEVLSPTTEAYDRGEKFARYRRVFTLSDYVLISPNAVRLEHYSRQDDGGWMFKEYTDLRSSVEIPTLGVRLELREVYDKVRLPDPDGA